MKITKEVATIWFISIALIFVGIGYRHYLFEALSITLILFGYLIAKWDEWFGKQRKTKKKEKNNATK